MVNEQLQASVCALMMFDYVFYCDKKFSISSVFSYKFPNAYKTRVASGTVDVKEFKLTQSPYTHTKLL